MVSERRAARAGLGRPPVQADGIPEWVWGDQVRPRQWARDHGGLKEGRYDAVMEWRERCRQWLDERGLVMDGVNVAYEECRRIKREEPHRVLRRPVRPYGDSPSRPSQTTG